VPENEPDDVLSQDEVNDLLSNLPGADEVEDEQTEEAGENDNTGPRVRIYDFLRPDILSVEEVQMLTADGERIAEAANRSLSALGLADAALTVTSVDVLTLDEYIRSLSRPCYVVPFVYDGKRTVTV
jgi:flagellar motor switch protein FliM